MTDLQSEGAEGNAIEQKPTESAPVETAAPEQSEGVEAEAPKAEAPKPEEQWPKKAVNALSKKERQIGKLRAELDALRQQTAQYQQPNREQQSKKAPQPQEFKDADEYYDARAEWVLEQKLAEKQQESARNQQAVKEQELARELETSFVAQVEEAKQKLPDFDQVRAEAVDEIDALPPHITRVCLEAEDGVLALYQLAKEGRIQELAEMSPTRAAQMLARMGDKAKATLTKPKPISKAPEPMAPVKGSSRFEKSVEQMSGEELMKHYGLK